MKKKNFIVKNIVIIGVIIVALIGGILLINKMETKSNNTPSATTAPKFTVYKIDQSNIDAFTIKMQSQELNIKSTADGKWEINGVSHQELDLSKVGTLVLTINSIISNHEIDKKGEDLTKYGLDKPYITIDIKGKDGSVDKLLIGDKSPTIGEYFILKQGDATVYTISSYNVDTLAKPLIYYQTFNRFNVQASDITNIILERKEKPTLELRLKNDLDTEKYNIAWKVVQPFNGVFNAIDQFVNDKILTPISKLQVSELANADIDYGFSNPTGKVTIKVEPKLEDGSSSGKAYHLKLILGKTENNKTYVMFNDKAYSVDTQSLEFVFTDEFLALSKLQGLVDITQTSNVTVTGNNKTFSIDIKHEDNDKVSFTVNGNTANEKTSKVIYQKIIALNIDGLYNNEPLGNKEVTIAFKGYNGGEDVTIEFSPINELSYALTRNGKTNFSIKKSQASQLLSDLDVYLSNPNINVKEE